MKFKTYSPNDRFTDDVKSLRQTPVGFKKQSSSLSKVYLSKSKEYVYLTNFGSTMDNSGAAGTVFGIDGVDDKIIKIYCDSYSGQCNATKFNEEKINFICSHYEELPLKDKICWPIESVYSDESCSKFLGFVMKKVPNREREEGEDFSYDFISLGCESLINSCYMKKLDRIDIINFFIELLKIFDVLHNELGIVYGDVHGGNFLIDKKSNIYVIDVDSIQIDKYPSVYIKSEEYIPPFILKKFGSEAAQTYLDQYYRSFYFDNYCLAIMLFNSLVSIDESFPFNTNDDDYDEIDAIVNGKFPYKLEYEYRGNDVDVKKEIVIPKHIPQHTFITWTNLPHYVKEAFVRVFVNGEDIKETKWIHILKSYKKDLEENRADKAIRPRELKTIEEMKLPIRNRIESEGYSIYNALGRACHQASTLGVKVTLQNAKTIMDELKEKSTIHKNDMTLQLVKHNGVYCKLILEILSSTLF